MPRRKIPNEIVALYAHPDHETSIEWMDLWLPSTLMRALEHWAEREGTTPLAVASRLMCDAINMEDASQAMRR